jgi:hypothetical protein
MPNIFTKPAFPVKFNYVFFNILPSVNCRNLRPNVLSTMHIRVFGRTVAFVSFLFTFTITPIAAIAVSDGGKYTGRCYYLPTDP